MKPIRFIQCAAISLLILLISGLVSGSAAESKPNIVFILADDLGYGDVACYSSTKIKTPNIDALAASGIKATRYYDACGVCSPTRASLLTGRYPLRYDITRHFDKGEQHLVREAVTLPKLLKTEGYVSAHVGKWHLGGLTRSDLTNRATARPGPHEQGFDHYLCLNEEQPEPRARLGRERQVYHQGSKYFYRDDQPCELSPKHLTEVHIDESIRYLEEFAAGKKPFFLNVWFDTPHKPYEESTEEYIAPYRGAASGDDLLYRSMVAHCDGGVGRIMAALKRLGVADNTIVIFSSDNGPTGPGSSGPWRGGKGTLFEGGLRVPFIVSWPGKIKPGAVTDEFLLSTDFFPTLCETVGINPPREVKLDGQSILPVLLGKGAATKRGDVFWFMTSYPAFYKEFSESPPIATEAMRRGEWKLLAKDASPLALFDLDADPREEKNLLETQKALAIEMAGTLKSWLAEPHVTWKKLP